jgi:hypothetical protein
MSMGLRIAISGLGLTLPGHLASALRPAAINPVIGRAASNTVVAHLRRLNNERPNQLGGKRTNFYASAARGTSYSVISDTEVTVSIAHVGIRQRFFGGKIVPTGGRKFLTIPAAAEAHGKRAREFSDLEVVFGMGGRPIGLARKAQGKRQFGTILFRLVRSVNQRPDPSVLPDKATIAAACTAAGKSHIERAKRRDATA